MTEILGNSMACRVRTIFPSYYRIGRQSDYRKTIVPDSFCPIIYPIVRRTAVLLSYIRICCYAFTQPCILPSAICSSLAKWEGNVEKCMQWQHALRGRVVIAERAEMIIFVKHNLPAINFDYWEHSETDFRWLNFCFELVNWLWTSLVNELNEFVLWDYFLLLNLCSD